MLSHVGPSPGTLESYGLQIASILPSPPASPPAPPPPPTIPPATAELANAALDAFLTGVSRPGAAA